METNKGWIIVHCVYSILLHSKYVSVREQTWTILLWLQEHILLHSKRDLIKKDKDHSCKGLFFAMHRWPTARAYNWPFFAHLALTGNSLVCKRIINGLAALASSQSHIQWWNLNLLDQIQRDEVTYDCGSRALATSKWQRSSIWKRLGDSYAKIAGPLATALWPVFPDKNSALKSKGEKIPKRKWTVNCLLDKNRKVDTQNKTM